MNRFARTLVILIFLAVAAVIAVSLLAPHYLQSLQDRATRLPGTPEILKPKLPLPLSQKLAEKGLKRGQPVFVRIMKESSELELWMDRGDQWVMLHTYPVCRWSGALGPKLKEGDGQAPEGFYAVTRRALNPNSSYHLSFNLGFPNAYDAAHGRTGSFLMVHGDCLSIGCYAMTDAGIEEIYGLVEAALKAGQQAVPVHVFPFRMTEANLVRFQSHSAAQEWINLKQGWDWFDVNRRPPVAQACGKRYQFGDGTMEGCRPIAGM
jgi:murein L,D-transpeptidase YafK